MNHVSKERITEIYVTEQDRILARTTAEILRVADSTTLITPGGPRAEPREVTAPDPGELAMAVRIQVQAELQLLNPAPASAPAKSRGLHHLQTEHFTRLWEQTDEYIASGLVDEAAAQTKKNGEDPHVAR
jgi:hypothetical protein